MRQLLARRRPRPPWQRRRPRLRRRAWPLLLAGGLAALVLCGPLAGPAGAHATLVGTNPADDELIDAAPAEVELRFDEPVEVVEGGVRVIDPEGERADQGRVDVDTGEDGGAVLRVPMDGAGEGTYTVAWRVVSEDSHNLSGSFVFHVGVRTGSAELDEGHDTLVDAAGGVGRWAGFAGAFVVVGAGVLAALPASADPAEVRRRLLRLMLVAAGTGAAGIALSLVAQTARASGRSLLDAVGLTFEVALDTRTGVLGVLRLAALLLASLAAAAAAAAVRPRTPALAPTPTPTPTPAPAVPSVSAVGSAPAVPSVSAVGSVPAGSVPAGSASAGSASAGSASAGSASAGAVSAGSASAGASTRASGGLPLAAAAAGVASLVCASLSGHAWTAPSKALAVPVDLAHLVAVAVWLGGLVGLAVVLRRVADPPALVRWFSAAALVSVAVVVVTGTISGVVQVRTLDGLTSTGYGQLLLAKVAGFGVLVAFGAYHRRVLLPRVEQLVARLGRSLHAEIGVAVAVLAVTAVLINQPPARDAEADGGGPVDLTVTSEDGVATLQATVDPAEAGPNDLHLYFSDGAGAELVVNAVEVTAAIDDIPPRRLDVTPITPSHVSVLDASLTTPGLWALEVVAVTATATEATTFTLEVPIR